MHAFCALLEAGALLLHTDAFPALPPGLLAALRAEGVVRDEDPGFLEVSAPDVGRLLRRLHGALARGTPPPSTLDTRPVFLGWIPEKGAERALVLVASPRHALTTALDRASPARVLVPCGGSLDPALRARHTPGSAVELEALDETLSLRAGALVRIAPAASSGGGRKARRLPPPVATAGMPAASPHRTSAGRAMASPVFPGASAWTDVRISILQDYLVRVDAGKRTYRCTPADLGMAHPRSRRPTQVWEALEELLNNHGVFRTKRFGGVNATKKVISRLRHQLRALFGIEASPFARYAVGQGWRVHFVARPEPPGEGADDWFEKFQRGLGDKSQRKSAD